MPKYSSTSSAPHKAGVKGRQYGGDRFGSSIGSAGNDEGGRFVDRNLAPVTGASEQFEPMGSEPVRQRFKMGGGC
ncbi:MAG TPA: hypothetical protein VF077_08875 [Nitrospiraceae bacterium]